MCQTLTDELSAAKEWHLVNQLFDIAVLIWCSENLRDTFVRLQKRSRLTMNFRVCGILAVAMLWKRLISATPLTVKVH